MPTVLDAARVEGLPYDACQLYDFETQSPVGDPMPCDHAIALAPDDLWVVYRSTSDPGVVHGRAFQHGLPADDLEFDAETGRILEDVPG